MDVKAIYGIDYNDYMILTSSNSKYEWAAGHIFTLSTYDGALDELFVKKIIEVCKVILGKQNFEYIKNEENYITYILVCQLLNNLKWIEWGTSIRGAWFQAEPVSEPILRYYDQEVKDVKEIPFTIDNLKALIEFIEKE